MKELSQAASLSKVYTNHSIRSTATTLWADAGLSYRDIMTLSGNRNENSLKSYNARPSSQQLQLCNNVISSALNPQATQADQQIQVLQQQLHQSGSAADTMIHNQQNFTRQDKRFNLSTMFSGCQIGQVHVTLKRAVKHNDIHVELTLTPRLKVLPCRTVYFEHVEHLFQFWQFSAKLKSFPSGRRSLQLYFDFCNADFD